MNIVSGLIAYSKAKDAAAANHISGWIGTAAAIVAGYAVSKGWVAEIQTFVCQATMDDVGLAVGVIVAVGSWTNSLSTKALSPPKTPATDDSAETAKLNAAQLAKIKAEYPVIKD